MNDVIFFFKSAFQSIRKRDVWSDVADFFHAFSFSEYQFLLGWIPIIPCIILDLRRDFLERNLMRIDKMRIDKMIESNY